MPYIPHHDRLLYYDAVLSLSRLLAHADECGCLTGHLNFVLSALAACIIHRRGKSYHRLSAIRAAMNDASAEFYRRVMAPYEDGKIACEGDVYTQEPSHEPTKS